MPRVIFIQEFVRFPPAARIVSLKDLRRPLRAALTVSASMRAACVDARRLAPRRTPVRFIAS
ncbi:hypothetical protein DPV74_26935 [Burkholderia sp. HAN2018]|nr:hypothetical protein [Burkholderia sp. HAN2018]